MRTWFPVLALALGAAAGAFSQPSYLIQTGHAGPVTGLEYQPLFKTLVTAGNDGTVKIWETDTFTAVATQRIASRAITLLALHPLKTRYAAVYEEQGVYRLSVRDWSANQELYSIALPAKPLFVDFSPRGTYLAVCLEDWKSLSLYDAEKGDPIKFMSSGFGIISFVTFSSKETTIMAYQPAGRISYWELGSGKKISEFKTKAGLVPVCLSSNKLQLVCSTNDQLVFLDAVNGKQTAGLETPGLILSRGERQGTNIAFCSGVPGGKESLHFFSLNAKTAKEMFAAALVESAPVTALAVSGDAVYAGNRDGEVYRVRRSGTDRVVKNVLLPVWDVAASGDKLVLAGSDRLFVYRGGLFDDGRESANEMAFASFVHPFAGNRVGLKFHDKNGLYIWKADMNPGALDLLDPETFVLKRQAAAFASPLLKMTVGETFALSIEQSGLCRVSGLDDPASGIEYQSAGLNAAAFLAPARIILGKSRLSSYESALAVVMGGTGEITFLPEQASIIYDLAYDEKNRIIYYTGIEKINDVASTVVKYRTQDLTNNPTVVFAKPGRYLSSCLASDPERGRLYFAFEDNELHAWDGTAVQDFEASPQPIRKILPHGNVVYGLNDDSTLTVWNAETRKIIFTLSLFENGAWLLVTEEGNYVSGGGQVAQYVKAAGEGAGADDLPEANRLDVKVTSYVKDSP
jgi:WD40 repeat protein